MDDTIEIMQNTLQLLQFVRWTGLVEPRSVHVLSLMISRPSTDESSDRDSHRVCLRAVQWHDREISRRMHRPAGRPLAVGTWSLFGSSRRAAKVETTALVPRYIVLDESEALPDHKRHRRPRRVGKYREGFLT